MNIQGDDIFLEMASRELSLGDWSHALHNITQAAKSARDTGFTPSHGTAKHFLGVLTNRLQEMLHRDRELVEALKAVRRVASEALDLADRCHGGHSYESLGSQQAKKCCEARMQVDDLKFVFRKLAETHAKFEEAAGDA